MHPQARAFLDFVGEVPALDSQTTRQNRSDSRRLVAALSGEPAAVHQVVDTEVHTEQGNVALRVYRPSERDGLPVVVYFHGGGWVLGDLDLCDNTCRALCSDSGTVVVSVDYRKAPEHPFPAAYDDALAITESLLDGTSGLRIDPDRVAVAGDSAGGNLAAAVALALRNRPGLRHQALVYPVTQIVVGSTQSYLDFADGYFLTARDMQYLLKLYAPDADPGDARLAPLSASDLTSVPPATVVLAECDPLHDEGEQYAARLAEAGVPVTVHLFEGQVHPFIHFDGLVDAAHAARRVLAEALAEALR
ncbi:alpha/beta hydrolase [Spongiactinospora sp. 9N601]|uniref:alpha/beta hydrolase n=1 Tax=Spongiactinospora sp. 9N601 TaxID=3375149 RepID=UPI0037A0378B